MRDLDVAEVGVVQARPPTPASAANLAMAANPDVPAEDRPDYVTAFLRQHLADGEYERLVENMMDGMLPADALGRVARAIATTGTARPYLAVINLSVLAAHNWRTIRARLASYGITDAMSLGSLHMLLDMVEAAILESKVTGDRQRDERERTLFLDRLYAPEPADLAGLNGDYEARPAGFSEEEQEASFDAFMRAVGG